MIYFRRFLAPLFLLPASLLVVELGLPDAAGAQVTARVTSGENLRAEPNGTIVGQLSTGTDLLVISTEGNWSEVTLEGFVWERSMLIDRTDGFDLVISEAAGENIRDEPGGRIAGQLVRGARLEEVERVPGWVRVRRTAWIWTPSIELRGAAPPPAGAAAGDVLPAVGRPETSVEVIARGGEVAGVENWLTPGRAGLWLLVAPEGDSLARVQPGADLQVLARQGNWARVRLEGWVWATDAGVLGDEAAEAGVGPLLAVTIPELKAEPDRFRGRRLRLELQFISLERAGAVRTDFYEGEPFLLMRTRTPDRTFVYVAVSLDRVAEFERLVPLENLAVTGRLRRADAAFTGNPIIDLLEFERIR